MDNDQKMMTALSYILSITLLVPLIIFLVKKDEEGVKFHALQSLALSVIHIIISIVFTILGGITFGLLWLILGPIYGLLLLAYLVYVIILTVQVYQDQDPEIPLIGNLVREKMM